MGLANQLTNCRADSEGHWWPGVTQHRLTDHHQPSSFTDDSKDSMLNKQVSDYNNELIQKRDDLRTSYEDKVCKQGNKAAIYIPT